MKKYQWAFLPLLATACHNTNLELSPEPETIADLSADTSGSTNTRPVSVGTPQATDTLAATTCFPISNAGIDPAPLLISPSIAPFEGIYVNFFGSTICACPTGMFG